jgi:hypothetical protein
MNKKKQQPAESTAMSETIHSHTEHDMKRGITDRWFNNMSWSARMNGRRGYAKAPLCKAVGQIRDPF